MTLNYQGDNAAPTLSEGKDLDPEHAIEIADNIWWVGHYLEDDPFQCHVYLLENGDQSVLFDPGSKLTFKHTFRKIQEVTNFSNIRYFVCHHQDPDITGCLEQIDKMVTRDDALLVTHWRAEMLLKHYGLDLPFWRIEDHDWKLDLGNGRVLEFVFTPYAHFPGAFCSFDHQTGTMFSSDIFGGFTENFSLFADDESYFEALRPFHEHYIPSKDILCNVVDEFEKLPLKLIAPQHGSVIPEHLIDFMLRNLRTLDCGLYLMQKGSADLDRLMQLNQVLRDMTQTMIIYRDFSGIVVSLMKIVGRVLPVSVMDFFALLEGEVLHLGKDNRYRGTWAQPDEEVQSILGMSKSDWESQRDGPFAIINGKTEQDLERILVPLFSSQDDIATSAVVMQLQGDFARHPDIKTIVSQMSLPLSVAMEREIIYRTLDLEKNRIYERSVRDSLTGLYNRSQLDDTVERMISAHNRDENLPMGVIMVDIDHFKHFNDEYGHNQGDLVLKTVSKFILDTIRQNDFPVRMGGEEFAIFVVGDAVTNIVSFADRLREGVSKIDFDSPVKMHNVTVSVGTAVHKMNESMDDLINRADIALYEAKNGGRNKSCNAL